MKQILTEPMHGSGLTAWIGRLYLKLIGWRYHAPADLAPRCIIMVYPHTSNWDFPIGLAFKWASGMQVNYLGKDSLFRSPLGWFFRATGGMPVDRSQPRGMVGGMIDALKTKKIARFVISPEGTRSYVPAFKSGFYRAAVEANVPMALSTIDFNQKFVGIFDTIALTGDEATDLATMETLYAGKQGLNPKQMGPFVFPPKK
jgi:1-acyl-sn-glycerol-3-phosphate acyltransferase